MAATQGGGGAGCIGANSIGSDRCDSRAPLSGEPRKVPGLALTLRMQSRRSHRNGRW